MWEIALVEIFTPRSIICAPEKVDKSPPKIFGGCYSTKPLTMQNFVVIE